MIHTSIRERVSSRRSVLRGATAALIGAGLTGFATGRRVPGVTAQGASLRVVGVETELAAGNQTMFSRFAEQTGIATDYATVPYSELTQWLTAKAAGGQAPDVTGLPSGAPFRHAIAQGLVYDFDGGAWLERLIPSIRELVAPDGFAQGLPLASYCWGVFYHRPLFESVGIEPPPDWARLIEAARLLSDKGLVPMLLPSAEAIAPYFLYMLAVSSALGVEGWGQFRRQERLLTDADLVGAAQLVADLVPYFNPDFQSLDFGTGILQFLKQEAAMTIGSTSDFAYLETSGRGEFGDTIGFFPFPSPDGSLPPATVSGLDSIYAITSDAAPAEASRLLTWLVEPETQRFVADTMALPVTADVTEIQHPIASDVATARGWASDLPVWFAIPETGDTFNVARVLLPEFLGGKYPADQFAEGMQASITPPGVAAS